MKRLQRILYVSQAAPGTEGLKQAVSIARNNDADLHVLVLYPALPVGQLQFKTWLEKTLVDQFQEQLEQMQATLGYCLPRPALIEFASGHGPGTAIVRHVQRGSFDLVVKDAGSRADGKGFLAVDMDLLRKCPCPVWLSRPIERSRGEMRVAVAIDPETQEPVERDLAVDLLRLGRSLADDCDGQLRVISCWDCEFENFLRNSPWSQRSEEDVRDLIQEVQADHGDAVADLITASGITGDIAAKAERGRPAEVIPAMVLDEEIDVLVMGTVARTGIQGFIMGNTAENVLQQLSCSLLTLKPRGFASPVSVY